MDNSPIDDIFLRSLRQGKKGEGGGRYGAWRVRKRERERKREGERQKLYIRQ